MDRLDVLRILAFILVLVVIKIGCDHMNKPKEGYANQVVHAVGAGIAGPIMDPSLFEYTPAYGPPKGGATALWALPPQPPA